VRVRRNTDRARRSVTIPLNNMAASQQQTRSDRTAGASPERRINASDGCGPQKVRMPIKRGNFADCVDVNYHLPAADLNGSIPPGGHAQDRAVAPIVASYPYYYNRPKHPVPAMGTLFPSCLECGGTVPAQAASLLPGTSNFTSQAHCRRPFFFGVVVSILLLERGIDHRQTGDPHGLASPGISAMVAVEVALGTTADSGGSPPVDGEHGTGESDMGRGA